MEVIIDERLLNPGPDGGGMGILIDVVRSALQQRADKDLTAEESDLVRLTITKNDGNGFNLNVEGPKEVVDKILY